MPVNRDTLDAQLREIGEGERWWEHREFRELPRVLYSGERIQALVAATLLTSRRPRLLPAAPWLVVATDQWLLCLRQGRFARQQIDLLPAQIVRVHQRSRLRAFHITLHTPLQRLRLRIAKDDAFRFASALARLAPEASAPVVGGALPSAAAPAALAAPATGAGDVERLEAAVQALQHEVARLGERVAALENGCAR